MSNKDWFDDEQLKELLGSSEETEETTESKTDLHYEDTLPNVETKTVQLEEFSDAAIGEDISSPTFDMFHDLNLPVKAVLGRVKMPFEKVMALEEGSVVKLNKMAGEPVEIMVGDQLIAKGEVVVIDDRFGVFITEILVPKERVKMLEKKVRR